MSAAAPKVRLAAVSLAPKRRSEGMSAANTRHVEVFRVDSRGNPDLAHGIKLAIREGQDFWRAAVLPAAAKFGLDPKGGRLATLYGLEIPSFNELRPEISHLVFLQEHENFCRPVRTTSEALQAPAHEAGDAVWRPGFVVRVVRADTDYQQPVLFTVRPEMTLGQAVAGCARLLKMKAEGMALFTRNGEMVGDLSVLRDGDEVSIRQADGSSIVLAKTPEKRAREAEVGVGTCTPPSPASPAGRERVRDGVQQTCILNNTKAGLEGAPADDVDGPVMPSPTLIASPSRRAVQGAAALRYVAGLEDDCTPVVDPSSADVALGGTARASPHPMSGRAKTPQRKIFRPDPDAADRPLAELASTRSMGRGRHAEGAGPPPDGRGDMRVPPLPPAPPPAIGEGLASPKQRPRAPLGEPPPDSLLASLASWSLSMGFGRLAAALQGAQAGGPRTLGIPREDAETPWLRVIAVLGYCCRPKGAQAAAQGAASTGSSVAHDLAASADFSEMLRRNPLRSEGGEADSSFAQYRDAVRSLGRRGTGLTPPSDAEGHARPAALP